MTIKQALLRCQRLASLLGFDPRMLVDNMRGLPGFIGDLQRYSAMNPPRSFRASLTDMYPILNQRRAGAGAIRGHYFHQDMWAATKIFERRPPDHLDVGSRIDGFVAHVLVFMPVTLVDIRPIKNVVRGLRFIQDNATDLSTLGDSSVDSLSSLHAAEHFGLGRYSDPVDPNACFRFMHSLQRVLRPSGRLYFSVPVGRERVDFNAHRVFAVRTVLANFSKLDLIAFSWVSDDGSLHENVDPAATPETEYGCGLFEFTKPG